MSERDVPAAAAVLSVVRGEPTASDLAAVIVVLTARARQAGPVPAPAATPSQWSARARQMRPQLMAGQGAWRASALPG
jgi:Acyl-CoA carboxylase epsilon subunit